jgi:2-C-methyl-D-erythritol 2,4-cyclodiphosphate synthase
MTNIRVGMGYDVHQLSDNIPFLLGGVKLDYKKGIVAHSDGDIVFHAISDALLGAAGLGDIGHFFPDTDLKYKNIDSQIILSEVLLKLEKLSYILINIDITIVLQKPKISPIIPEIKASLSNILKINVDRINIKATTTEWMGFVGREKGISCYTVALIEKI